MQTHQSAESFYHLAHDSLQHRLCQGLACFAGRGDNSVRWKEAQQSEPRVYCLGKCYCGPASAEQENLPQISSRATQTVLLGRLLDGGASGLAAYRANGGYQALLASLKESPADIIQKISESGLRGRGGAGFPTGRKWQAVAQETAPRKYIVANADEGDPGSFSDRFLMELDPFRLIESMTIAARAVGASRGYIYLRKEYPQALAALQQAIAEAEAANLLGGEILGSAFEFKLEITLGQGSYVCGEETSMLNSIEGKRPEVRARPPQITAHGLFDAPTLVNNVETLCNVTWIIVHGAAAYQALGVNQSRGTKLISLSSSFHRPGLVEVDFGISLRQIVEDVGGGLKHGPLKTLMVGGPLAGLIPPSLLDTPLAYEEMQAIGAAVGHGGVIGFGADSSIAAIAEQVFRFGAYESCGKCTPCHLGSPIVARAFTAIVAGQSAELSHDDYNALIEALAQTSLCGHGRGLAEFAQSLQHHFHEELQACWQ